MAQLSDRASLLHRVLCTAALAGFLNEAAAQADADRLATRSGWEIGVQASHYAYEEQGFLKLEGNRGGASLARTYTGSEGTFGRVEFGVSYGLLDLRGGNGGTAKNAPDFIAEFRVVAGMDFRAAAGVMLSPFAGVGLRYRYDDLRGHDAANAPVGFRSESTISYAPLGLAARVSLGGDWVLAPSAEVDLFGHGRQTTHLSDLGTGTSDLINSQARGQGYRARLALEQERWAFGAWAGYWRVNESDLQSGGAYIPLNHTREAGLDLRYRF